LALTLLLNLLLWSVFLERGLITLSKSCSTKKGSFAYFSKDLLARLNMNNTETGLQKSQGNTRFEVSETALLKEQIHQYLLQTEVKHTEMVLVEVKDGVATVRLNRPTQLNALDSELLILLYQTIERLEADPQIKTIILTGTERAFTVGADIPALYEQRAKAKEVSLTGQYVFRRIAASSTPVIAAINGFALGGGYELALSTHYRIAGKDAILGQPEITLGIIPGYGGTQRLSRLVGQRTAALICLSGEQLNAHRALLYGLVDELASDAWEQAQKLGRVLASGQSLPKRQERHQQAQREQKHIWVDDPVLQRLLQENRERGHGEAARLIFQAIKEGFALELERSEDLIASLFAQAMNSSEAQQSLCDFLNKRQHPSITMPAVFPIEQLPDVPETRSGWIIRKDGVRGLPTTALERVTLSVPDIGDEKILLRVFASPAEANAGRWLPLGIPVDIVKAHGLRYHIPGNNGVGIIVARGALVPNLPHLQLGSWVVTHNASSRNPYDSRMLRGDADMELFVTGYDEFQAKPDGPLRSGTYTDYAEVDYERVMPMPEHLTVEQAAVYLLADPTIWHSNRRTRLSKGNTLLLVGASGSTGIRAIEIAKILGVRRVIGLVSTQAKKEKIENLSIPEEFEVVGLLRTEFNFSKPDHVDKFVEKIKELNDGNLVDVALDFFGAGYPNAFLKAVKSGDATKGISSVGRFTSYGAELEPLVEIEGVAGTATVETMFKAVEDVRDLPQTDEVLEATLNFLGDTPQTHEALRIAKESMASDRAIKRVLTYGADSQTLEVLKASKERHARVVVVVRDAQEAERLRELIINTDSYLNLKGGTTNYGFIALSDLVHDNTMNERGLLQLVQQHLHGKPDVIVERAYPQALLGLPKGVETLKISHFRLLRPGGQVVFVEDTSRCRFTIDMRAWVMQRDILFPSKYIILTHYASQTECWLANEMVRNKQVKVAPPNLVMAFNQIAEGLERQGEGKVVFLHG
jgi:enoyl-CoA hydratase/carnithine racemase/NADPH:quinone reductase-like Zn-dependent oxidoreductase